MKTPTGPARVRFAPSPTGPTHLGSGRTALYNYLLARQTGGQFILRIEDTDRERYDPNSEKELIDSLHWLGLQWEEGPEVGGPHAPYYQSKRKEIYLEYAQRLIESGHAYYCFCSPERLDQMRQEQQRRGDPPHYDGTCLRLSRQEAAARVAAGEPHVIRFKMPKEGSITVTDKLRGEIVVENRNLDDYIIVRSDGFALYHLAAMVDDHLMEITHVIRGAEWLSTFPLHAHIIRAFGWEEPEWVHLSLFLKPSGKGKMSKRDTAAMMKDGQSIYLKDLEAIGYLPEAVVNWIALMGWGYDATTEYFTMDDLIEKFSLEGLKPSPAAINFTKLDHFNGLHIRNMPIPELARRLKPYFRAVGYQVDDQQLLKITPIIQERIVTLDDAPQVAGIFFQEEIRPNPEELAGKDLSPAGALAVLHRSHETLAQLPDFSPERTEPLMRALVEELNLNARQFFGVLRVAITGQSISPPLFESMQIFGREKVLHRLQNAIKILES